MIPVLLAGELKHRVTVERRVANSPARTASGAPAEQWETYKTIWAAIHPLTGRELLQAGQIQSEVTVRIRTRYLRGLTAGMRIVHKGRYYAIDAVINNALENASMELLCTVGASDV